MSTIKKLFSIIVSIVLIVSSITTNVSADTTGVGVSYQAHIQNIGWQDWVSDGQEAGTDGKSLRVEALKIKLTNAPFGAKIKYEVHVQNIGWQAPVYDGEEAGTDGKSLRVEAIKISLENMPGYSVQYQAYVQNIGWQDWVSDGQEAGTDGKSLRVEAIRIKIVPKEDTSIHPTSLSLNKTTCDIKVGQTDTLTANVLPENATNKAVNWTTSNEAVAKVDNTGKVTAVGTGNATILATTLDGGKTATCSVIVNEAVKVTDISLSKSTDSLNVGQTDTLIANILPANADNKDVVWTSSNNYIATVDNTGKVTAVSAGNAVITATTADGNKVATCNLTVNNSANDGVSVSYQGNVEKIGWQNVVSDGEEAGTEGQSLKLEGIKINLINAPTGARIKYEAQVENVGWQPAVYDGELSGTEGCSLRLEAIKISLENMPGYSVEYKAQVQNVGWQSWVKNGDMAGTVGKALRLEAIKIRIVKNISVQYAVHVQNVGWETPVSDGIISGTNGKDLRIEALNINLVNAPSGASIKYQTQVQNIGWQDWTTEGENAGTEGQSLRVEALKIQLVNAPSYSVQYQVDVETLGWQPWVQDGQQAGTVGKGLRIKGIRIKVISNPDGVQLPQIPETPSSVINSTSYKLASYLQSDDNVGSVVHAAVALHDGDQSNNCVYFSSEALRRIGVNVPLWMENTRHYVPYLKSIGWTQYFDINLLSPGNIAFTINGGTGNPTHTFVFLDWVNPDDHTLAYVADNQSIGVHIRSMVNTVLTDAFSFFFSK